MRRDRRARAQDARSPARAVRAGHDVELADLRRRRGAVRLHADRPVRDAAQEQVASLAADIGHRRGHVRAGSSCCTDAVYW